MPFCIVSAAAEIGMLPGMDDSTLVSPFDSTLDTPTTVRAHLQAGSDRMLPDEFHRNDRSAYLKCSNSHPDMNHGRGVIPGTTHPALETKTLIDASLLLGMERTLFASLNMAWIVMFVGMGLMMVGAEHETLPDQLGSVTLCCGIVFSFASWCHHAWRIRTLNKGKGLGHRGSLVWTLCLTLLVCTSICFEVYYALRYPYLKRSKVVELADSGN